MTKLTDFKPDDLAVLNRTPTAVAIAAAYAEQDGAVSLVREMRAGLTAAREAAFAFPENEVIQALAVRGATPLPQNQTRSIDQAFRGE